MGDGQQGIGSKQIVKARHSYKCETTFGFEDMIQKKRHKLNMRDVMSEMPDTQFELLGTCA